MQKILIVDDQPYSWQPVQQELSTLGYFVFRSDSEKNAERMIHEFQPQLVMINLLQRRTNTWEFFHRLRCRWPNLRIMNYIPADMDAHESLQKAVNEVFRSTGDLTAHSMGINN